MKIIFGRVELLVDASVDNPMLAIVQNNGAAGSNNLFVGEDQSSLQQNGLQIAPGGASPQLTLTNPLFGSIDDTGGGASQDVIVNKQRLK